MSMDYDSFDQIDLPNLTVTEPNPAHALDFRRFSSDQVIAFNRAQVEVIRPHTHAPLIHNYMGRILEFDHFAVGADLEIASWDSYPLGFLEDRSDRPDPFRRRFARSGDPDFQAFHHDLYRAVGRGRWWVMEQQPGPVNWAPYNPAPHPGMARLWAWEAFAHGAEAVCYFRWRQAPFAQEQMHAGLLRPDNKAAPALAEAATVARELAELDPFETGPAPVAIVFDYQSAWAWDVQPQSRDFDYFRLVFDLYRALRAAGLSVDIVPPDTADLTAHKLIFVPGLLTWNDTLLTALETSGAVVLAGPRAGSKTVDMAIPDELPPALPGVTAKVTHVESLHPESLVMLERGGAFHLWREYVEADDIAEMTEDGYPAIVGKGHMRYLCGWPDEAALGRIINRLCAEIGLNVMNLPDALRVRDAGPYRFITNYGEEEIDLAGYIPGISGALPAAGVHWFRR